jgi:hypothetical protein
LFICRVEADVVEDEELGFRTEIGGVADAAGVQIFLRGLGDRARAAAIGWPVSGS